MKLPNRRPCVTTTTGSNGNKIHVTVGFQPDWDAPDLMGEPAELFVYGPKHGSESYMIMQERCVEASKRLQAGDEPFDFLPYIERDEHGCPRTTWGAAVDVLIGES